jgi:hypothetical protein
MSGGWLARINGVEVDLLAYGVEQAPDGSPVLSIAFTPGSLAIGDPSLGGAQPELRPATPETTQLSSWGAPGQRDPRENIPGWEPEGIGAQVAGHAERRATVGGAFRDLIKLRGGDGGSVVLA